MPYNTVRYPQANTNRAPGSRGTAFLFALKLKALWVWVLAITQCGCSKQYRKTIANAEEVELYSITQVGQHGGQAFIPGTGTVVY